MKDGKAVLLTVVLYAREASLGLFNHYQHCPPLSATKTNPDVLLFVFTRERGIKIYENFLWRFTNTGNRKEKQRSRIIRFRAPASPGIRSTNLHTEISRGRQNAIYPPVTSSAQTL